MRNSFHVNINNLHNLKTNLREWHCFTFLGMLNVWFKRWILISVTAFMLVTSCVVWPLEKTTYNEKMRVKSK